MHRRVAVVLATDEETPAHFSTPAATISRHNVVHPVVPVPELAPRLVQLVTAPRLGSSTP